MLIVIEVYVERAADADALLSDEVRLQTNAKIMTLQQAEAAGFQGFQPQLDKGQYRIIKVDKPDSQWVLRSLENHASVIGYQVHELYG